MTQLLSPWQRYVRYPMNERPGETDFHPSYNFLISVAAAHVDVAINSLHRTVLFLETRALGKVDKRHIATSSLR